MKRYLRKYMSYFILTAISSACLFDSGPVYINSCPCDITPYKDCDCDKDTTIEVRFMADVVPFFTDFCVICHSEQCKYINLKKGKAYENAIRYINLQNPIGSVIYQSVVLGYMPPVGVYSEDSVFITPEMAPIEEEYKILLEWINQGARNN